jgi:uncharacterized repeat protein (TIGR02543 family)
MFRRIWLVCILALLAVTADAAPTITPKSPSKVSGCYQISDAAELYGFASIVNGTDGFRRDSAACGKLVKDIVVNENVLDESGNLNVADTANFAQWKPMMQFRGKFDGNSHTISGLYVNGRDSFSALFGVLYRHEEDSTVIIRNLGVVGSYFFSHSYVGAIVGYADGGAIVSIENCFSNSRVESDGNYVGGLVGMSVATIQLKNVYNLGTVIAGGVAGGIAGYLYVGRIKVINAYNMGTISMPSSSYRGGGLVGYVNSSEDASFENCFNIGSVTGELYVGGIVGDVGGTFLLMDEVYNAGTIVSKPGPSGSSYTGGLVGAVGAKTKIQNAYNTGSVSGGNFLSGIFGLAYADISMTNVYNAGTLLSNQSFSDFVKPIVFVDNTLYSSNCENVFYLNETYSYSECGKSVTSGQLEDGSIAYLLHNSFYDSVNASVWGQDVGNDAYPNFRGIITGASLSSFEDLILHTYDGDTTTLPVKYLPGFELRLPVVTQDERVFRGWFDNAEVSGNAVEVIPATAAGTLEFWAGFKTEYSITYEVDGGTLDPAAAKSYISGDGVALLDPEPRLGYIFRGWYESEDFSGKRIRAIGSTEAGNKAFYARWLAVNAPSLDENGCYAISNASELYDFAAIVNGADGFEQESNVCGKLTNDIVVNENVLTEQGTLNMADTADFVKWAPIMQFGGTFDGQGHTISGLYFNDDLVDRVGLFGSAIDAEIKNVGVEGSFFRGDDEIGAVVGASVGTLMLDNVYSASRVEGAYSSVGGIVGVATGTGTLNIRNSYNLGAVVGKSNVGGLVGYTYVDTTTFVNVYNMGSVTCINGYSSYSEAGGIVGNSSTRLQIQNAYNVGSVYGQNYIGGIAGTSSGYNVLVNVYNAGAVSSLEEIEYCVGPIAGYAYKSSSDIFENVFYLDVEQGSKYGDAVTDEMVKDGSLAYLLHNYFHSGVDGSIWGQDVEKDDYPNFSGVITEFPSDLFEDLVLHTFEGDTVTLPQKYLPGYAMRLPEPVYEGKMFVGWYESDGFDGNPVELIPATATGTQEFWGKYNDMYRVTLVTNGGTVDSLDVASYVAGIGCDLPNKVSRKGYIFRGWYESEDFDGDRAFQVGTDASGDKTFYAKWFKIETPSKDDEGCYVIKNASELYGFAALVNGTPGHSGETEACASLDSDIVVNENVIDQDGNINEADSVGFMQWTPINGFSGKFDGKGHVVRGLYFNESTMPSECDDENGCGFFGWLGENSQNDTIVIENLGIEGSYFAYHDYILGALVGAVQGSLYSNSVAYVRISNCYSTSTVVSDGYVGGIVGKTSRNTSTVIENCYNTGKIVARDYAAGGLVGLAYYGVDLKVLNSYNTGTIMVEGRQKPGVSLIGYDYIIADVENSYYLKVADSVEYYGYAVTSEQFENGVVATALHGGENGSIWGQNVGKDPLPNFSGKVKNSAAVQYKVTFHTFDGDTASFFKKYVAGLPKQLPKKPVRNGYRFSGWYVDSTFAGKPVTSINETDSGDLDFYAYWVANWYTVRVYSGLGGTVAGLNPSGSYTYGDTVDLEAQPYEGYRFSYWGDNLDSANAKRQVVIVSDTTFSVYFAKASSSSVSSSSAKSSSSSAKAKSSSSSAGSSSSKKAKSSSSKGTKSSSSCSGDKCGKDLPIVFELVCNGKKCSNALSAKVAVPQFRVVVVGRDIQVMEARVGSPYALFDLQGGLVRSGQVGSVDFTIPAPHSGSFLVRVGNRIKRVTVR